MENIDVFPGLHDFLERMRKPSAGDFVKSIKSFIVSFSNHAPDPEKDSEAVQEFFTKMEAAFRAHPLWSGSSEEELDSAADGLEKYVMTKLFTRVFASNTEDVISDEKLFQKMSLVQQFISPESLDIQPTFQNETSWLLAQKELQKMNMYKAPRDKLMCILSCCKVINNLLLNASIASKENAPGADEFLPVLIYVTIKANPPQFHSNLLYIQRYRRQSKLVGEASYFFTNLLSAESFISNIDAKSLSMDEADFENKMESARARLSGLGIQSYQTDHGAAPTAHNPKRETTLLQSQSSDSLSGTNETLNQRSELPIKKAESISDLENKGAATLLNGSSEASKILKEYPYVFASAGDLRVGDVEGLLNDYKQLVFKYVCLSKGLGEATTSLASSSSPLQPSTETETEDQTTVSSDVQTKTETDRSVDDLMRALQGEGDNVHKLSDVKQEDYKRERVCLTANMEGIGLRGEILRLGFTPRRGVSGRSPVLRRAMVIKMRDRSKNRKPLQRGRMLSIEAIQAVQALKRANPPPPSTSPSSSSSMLDRVIDSKIRRLLKFDMVAVLRELLRQNECSLSLKVFEEIRKEYWYKPQVRLYADMITVMADNSLIEELYYLYAAMKSEKGLAADTESFNTLLVILLNHKLFELVMDCYAFMQSIGYEPDRTSFRILVQGLESNGETALSGIVRQDAHEYYGESLEFNEVIEDISSLLIPQWRR
uniref:Vacuolar protein sorting-associated protein 9A n=1 Tax=Brassica campestris TaxID=3711 RepID=A0A3P6DMJ6_BRACM|nr:unnamed protein product [Brassica rapa]